MGSLLQLLIKEHGGKTMFGSLLTLMFVGWTGMEAGLVPVPASRDYVAQAVANGTKGLDYLVKAKIEEDLDALHYAVSCMNNLSMQSALSRLEDEYVELMGTRYAHKSCTVLEQQFQARGR